MDISRQFSVRDARRRACYESCEYDPGSFAEHSSVFAREMCANLLRSAHEGLTQGRSQVFVLSTCDLRRLANISATENEVFAGARGGGHVYIYRSPQIAHQLSLARGGLVCCLAVTGWPCLLARCHNLQWRCLLPRCHNLQRV